MPFEQQRIDHESGAIILALKGTMTMGNQLMSLEWAIEELLKSQHLKIVVDMTDISYLDSAAIGVVINCSGKVNAAGGKLRFANPSERVVSTFKLARIYDVLSPDATVEASLEQLNS